jgi:hypothetical protein
MERFPWRAAGDQRAGNSLPRLDAINGYNHTEKGKADTKAKKGKSKTNNIVATDDEEYNWAKDERFKFENGTVTAGDLLDRRVSKKFNADRVTNTYKGTCTGFGIDAEDGTTFIEVVYADGDTEDLTYAELKEILIEEYYAYWCGTPYCTQDYLSYHANQPDEIHSDGY